MTLVPKRVEEVEEDIEGLAPMPDPVEEDVEALAPMPALDEDWDEQMQEHGKLVEEHIV